MPRFSKLIETNQTDLSINLLKQKIETTKYKNILGCTHYPLILNNIKMNSLKNIYNPQASLT